MLIIELQYSIFQSGGTVMTKEQYDLLTSIVSVLDLLAYVGNRSQGLSYDMGQTCEILSHLLLNFIDDDAKQYSGKNRDGR